MILALHHEQFDESTINDPETSNPGFEQHAADALKAFVEQEEFKRSSGNQSKNKINFQEGPRASMKEEKDLLSPVLLLKSSMSKLPPPRKPNYQKHTNSSLNARQDNRASKPKINEVYKLETEEELPVDLLVDGQRVTRYEFRTKKIETDLYATDSPVMVQRDVVLTQRANPINIIIPQNE